MTMYAEPTDASATPDLPGTTDEPANPTFAELGVSPALAEALAAGGITTPFPIQELCIRDGLAGRDVCGKARTGSGKTLAFGLPLLQRLAPGAHPRRPRGLVLAPTRELAGQIVEVLKPLGRAAGLTVAPFYGGAPMDRQISDLAAGVDVAVATPGRMIDLLQREAIHLEEVEVLVIDEADRMADMGFLPQVEWILRRLRQPQTMLFSATLDGAVDGLVKHWLRDPVRFEVEAGNETVDEMFHRFLAVHEMDRIRVLATIARSADRTIVFVRTKRGADRLAERLEREGVSVAAIHGDLRQVQREKALERFSQGKLAVLVATDVAARGIHVDNVEVVVHFDLPEDHKAYLHRSGRTARAGQPGVVVTFVLWNQAEEVNVLRKRLGLSEPIVEVFSNDERLWDLSSFGGAQDDAAAATS